MRRALLKFFVFRRASRLMSHGRLAILAAAMAGVLAGFSAPMAQAETLQDVLSIAYQTNPTIRAERARQRATKETTRQAWAAALPQISGSASYSKVEQTQTVNSALFGGISEQSFTLRPVSAAVTGEQLIFNGFRNINAIRQARARVRTGGAQLASVEQGVLLQAATAYFDLLRDAAVFEANLNNVKVLLRQKDESDLRFEVGEITKTDVAQSAARLAGARANLTAAQAQLAVSRARFNEIIGSPPGTLDETPPLPDIPETEEAAQAVAAIYAPAVIAAKAAEQASRKQVAIEKGSFGPTVALTASYQYADQPSSFVLNDEQFAYGVRASIPLFQGGLRLSRVREARAFNDRDRMLIDAAGRRAASDVSAAWERYVASVERKKSARAQVEANELALTGVRRELQFGARTTLDVLNAEQEFLNATVARAEAERDERVAVFSLLAATGLLTLEAVGGSAALSAIDGIAEGTVAEAPVADTRVADSGNELIVAAADAPVPAPADEIEPANVGANEGAADGGNEAAKRAELVIDDTPTQHTAIVRTPASIGGEVVAVGEGDFNYDDPARADSAPAETTSADTEALPIIAMAEIRLLGAAQPALRDAEPAGIAGARKSTVNDAAAGAMPDAMPDNGEIKTASVLFGAHLASYRSAGAAHAGWVSLDRQFAEDLAGLTPNIAGVTIEGQGDFIRLIAGPISSSAEAEALCRRLEDEGQYCRVMGFDGDRLLLIESQ